MRPVANILVDLYDFQPVFNTESIDIVVQNIYESKNQYTILLKRLDQTEGWDIDINVLIWYRSENTSVIMNIGKSNTPEKRLTVNTDFIIYPGVFQEYMNLQPYKFIEPPNPIPISRQDFNNIFDIDMVVLPSQLYAVGFTDGKVFMYNEKYDMFYEIIRSINHILRVYLTYRNEISDKKFHFIICSGDGYMERHYPSVRTIPRLIGETDFQSSEVVMLDNPDEYAVLGKNVKYILGQSYQKGTPNAIGIPDRHYFYCNLYHSFRSFHRGIPFNQKINKVAFASRKERGSKYNFTERRDIETNQREYFYSDNVSKKNIFCSSGWVDSKDLVNYKYILDIDGIAATWDATAWKLNSGSVIFKTDSCWKQWFYDEFEPWKNYVPVKDDFSDIDERFEWCETHPEECKKMIDNNLKLFQKVYRYQNVVDYTLGIIDRILEP